MAEPTAPENGGRVTQRDLYDSIENLRLEQKGDLKDMKEELLKAINDALGEFRLYRDLHAIEHDSLERRGPQALGEYMALKAQAEARSEGSRAAYFSAIKFLNTNWKLILIALGVVASVLGTIDISSIIPK